MKVFYIFCMFFLFFNECLARCDELYTKSLYSYVGYLTTPSAYIKDGEVSLNYSYIPHPVSINSGDMYNIDTDNWIFSSSLGMFPFLEFYYSVFVEPQRNASGSIPNYGANKFRSAGAKLKIMKESKTIPSVAIGLFDPGLKVLGANYSANTVSSTVVIFSKHLLSGKSSLTIGYGSDILSGEFTRLEGIFGGGSFLLSDNIFLLCDYDSDYWSQGLEIIWKNINVEGVLTDFKYFSFRLGFDIDLLTHREK